MCVCDSNVFEYGPHFLRLAQIIIHSNLVFFKQAHAHASHLCHVSQVAYGLDRVRSALPALYRLAQGGTAVGTGLNTKIGFDVAVAEQVGRVKGWIPGWGGEGTGMQGTQQRLVPS